MTLSVRRACFFLSAFQQIENKCRHTVNYICEWHPQRGSLEGRKEKTFVSHGSDESNQIHQTDSHLASPHLNVCVTEHWFLCVPINMKKLCLILQGSEKDCLRSDSPITFVYSSLIRW